MLAHHGYFQKTGPENEQVIAKINNFRPDILCVGFGNAATRGVDQEKYQQDRCLSVTTLGGLPGFLHRRTLPCPSLANQLRAGVVRPACYRTTTLMGQIYYWYSAFLLANIEAAVERQLTSKSRTSGCILGKYSRRKCRRNYSLKAFLRRVGNY